MFQPRHARWLPAWPLTGLHAILGGIAAVAIPTLIRAAMDDVVTGCEFTPYLPFVLLSALLLRWGQASAVALMSVVTMGGLFIGPSTGHLQSSCFLSGAGIFLAGSAAMIGIAILLRRVIESLGGRGADESEGGIVFSLEKNEVWASWYGSDLPVRLGSHQKVEAMMEDFLFQSDLGRRLTQPRTESVVRPDA